jgi:hypothetical protein
MWILPAAFLLSAHLGINGIWTAYPIAFVAMLLVQAPNFHFIWRKKTVQRLI